MFALFVIACAVVSGAAGQQPPPSAVPAPAPAPAPAPLWGAALQEVAAAVQEIPGAECRHQATLVLEGVHNLTLWALRMADAWAKPPSELLRGNLRVLGDLDGCVGAAAPGGAVRGQYCLANVALDADGTDAAAWDALLDIAASGRRHGAEITRDRIALGVSVYPTTARVEWGVCAPAACAPADVEAVLNALARRQLAGTPLRADAHVPAYACQTQLGSPRALAAADHAFLAVFAILLLLMVIGTTYDVLYCSDYIPKDKGSAALRAFSVRANWTRLASERASGDVGCVDGVRALSTVWVVLTHKVLMLAQEPLVNKYRIFEAVSDLAKMPLVNSMLNVDTFFMMSGLLRSYNVVGALAEGRFNYTSSLLQRYLRLSPVYFFVVWFYATLFEYMGSGPAWYEFIGINAEICRESWFLNILYINNYIDIERMCVLQSWYLSADMQLFALAPLALVPLCRWRSCGRALMGALLAVAVAIPAVVIAVWRLPGVYQLSNTDQQINDYMKYVYAPTHTRMASYIVGLSLGYILHRLRDRKFTMAKVWATAGWVAAACMLVGVVYGPYHMMQMGRPYSLLENVLYGALHRVLWALAVAWLVFACHTGYGGLVNRLLNCYAMRLLSRLSYCVYLTHFIVLLLNSTRIRAAIWMDEFLLFHSFVGDLAITTVLSIFLFLTIESPVFSLLRIIFPRAATKSAKDASSEKSLRHLAGSADHQK